MMVSEVEASKQLESNAKSVVDKIRRARSQMIEEVPGWIVRHPTTMELSDNLTFIIAESKEGQAIPFLLPEASACVFVLEGMIECQEFKVLENGSMQIFRPGGAKPQSLMPREHPTRIICTFFKEIDHGPERGVAT